MLAEIFHAFQYEFMQNALIAGSFIGISCALIGVFLVLRKFSMIGDGLAHVSLATVALGLLLGVAPIAISLPLIILASLFILKLAERANLWGDSAIGFVSSVSVALAVIITSVSDGFNVDLFSYLFGSILEITRLEVYLSVILSVITVATIIAFYHDLFSLSFDEKFAQVTGIRVKSLNALLVILTGIIVVLGVRVVGTMLVSSMIVIPAITALQLARGFKMTLVLSVIFSLFAVLFGIVLSYPLGLPSGATIVLVNAALFGCASIVKRIME